MQASLPLADRRLDGTFAPYFWDVRQPDAYYPEIQSLRAAGITSGCATAPPQFCPDAQLLRRDAAMLLGRAFGVTPSDTPPARFTDVPVGASGYGMIQALALRGALAGCTATTFCPDQAVRRDDLAHALAVLAGATPGPGASSFDDLGGIDPSTAALIEALARTQRVDACMARAFCPAAPALRAPGAAWIVRSAGVPAAPPL